MTTSYQIIGRNITTTYVAKHTCSGVVLVCNKPNESINGMCGTSSKGRMITKCVNVMDWLRSHLDLNGCRRRRNPGVAIATYFLTVKTIKTNKSVSGMCSRSHVVINSDVKATSLFYVSHFATDKEICQFRK
jgi:hypothetical protein